MAFSVLMSLYWKEQPEFLRQSLESIFSQTLRADEVVLMEDGPITPELETVVKEFEDKYPELKVVPLPVNEGLGKALNEGIKYCSHDMVVRMDTDDISRVDRFKIQVDFMEKHPEIDCCSSWIQEFVETTDNVVSVKKVPEHSKDIYKFGKSRCPINHPAVIYRKQSVISCGGYGPFPEDYYLWGRMLKAGCVLHNLQESLVYFRFSEDVFKRRGGWKYNKSIIKLQKELYKMSYITGFQYIRNVFIRSIIALIPNWMRSLFYKNFLRSSR